MTKKEEQSSSYKNFLKFLVGSFILVLGITLTLVWWADVVSLFRGFLGMALAFGGLLVLYSLSK